MGSKIPEPGICSEVGHMVRNLNKAAEALSKENQELLGRKDDDLKILRDKSQRLAEQEALIGRMQSDLNEWSELSEGCEEPRPGEHPSRPVRSMLTHLRGIIMQQAVNIGRLQAEVSTLREAAGCPVGFETRPGVDEVARRIREAVQRREDGVRLLQFPDLEQAAMVAMRYLGCPITDLELVQVVEGPATSWSIRKRAT
jgi:hypothetical protein